MNKLNQQYFKTKAIHKKNYGKHKQSHRDKVILLIIMAILALIYTAAIDKNHDNKGIHNIQKCNKK